MARVYRTETMGEAEITVALVEDQGQADLCVHRVDTMGMASGDALWYFTEDRGDANVRVFFSSVGFCDVQIYFVDSYGQAGWQHSHPFKGKFSDGF